MLEVLSGAWLGGGGMWFFVCRWLGRGHPFSALPSVFPPRLQMDEELRREREREREREADREREKEREREQREKEREKELEREREKERERELERQREQRAREKELLAAKALEPTTFLPVAELHGLRGHSTEERPKPSEQLTPTRPGTWAELYGGNGLRLPQW